MLSKESHEIVFALVMIAIGICALISSYLGWAALIAAIGFGIWISRRKRRKNGIS